MYNGPERKLNRCRAFDYSLPGFYYLTICTKNRINWFGDVVDEKMILNVCGDVVNEFWKLIPRYYENVSLDKYIVMPNHMHGIIYIKNVGNGHCPIPTRNNYGLISKIINSFKNVCTKQIRYGLNCFDFNWQKSFYDRVLRDQSELEHARVDICNNPKAWFCDRNNEV